MATSALAGGDTAAAAVAAAQVLGRGDAALQALRSGGPDILSVVEWPFRDRAVHIDADPVLDWNQQALDAVRTGAASPLLATRALAMESIAMSVVLDAIDGAPARLASPEVLDAISTTAVASAAHRVLSDAFPAQKAALDAALAGSLAGVPDGALETLSAAFGNRVADAVIARRADDGWNAVAPTEAGADAGEWRPTPPGLLPALAPHWASVDTFALARADQFRPAGPPDLASADYAAGFEDVKRLGSATSAARTAEGTEIALFWADGAGSYTPPGHWNQIAADVAERDGIGAVEAARTLAALNVALFDAGVAAWDAKYAYDLWRPVTAIQLADADGNAATAADGGWSPLLVTPNHPEYVSGHAAFSGAAAEVLTAFFGDTAFSTTSITLPAVSRGFDGFDEAAAEAGRSRILGGIHFEFSNVDGLALGRAVGGWALDVLG